MLINISGIDGCGKSTQINLLYEYLISLGLEVEVTKAYGKLEKELFSDYIERADQNTIMFLFQAFHAQHRVATQRALDDGKIVLADRWDEAYEAYHSQFGILSENERLRNALNQIAYKGLRPDISFLMDIDPATAMSRCQSRGADFFDKKDISHHSKLRIAYKRIAEENPEEWNIISSARPISDIHEEVKLLVAPLLNHE